eukprot:CAMPEP_0118695254 /NCGR_PEP_ID=MMETSP0800-20121206/13069_1 /TAXON_ID=210618 ORGANISM="Striatella unipunctata, Strain CCMP2910" /NCGR_SAMPLE_ID=MMETSP0800 /ASSEMBLY_ACC=CAM_ASM_000638 /LENGTH=49 /DNA_ID= /DNA_START= /DNA_END= /DNA_ORIENTATION=
MKRLWLEHNKIGLDGAIALAEALMTNHHLETLHLALRFNNIGFEGAAAL